MGQGRVRYAAGPSISVRTQKTDAPFESQLDGGAPADIVARAIYNAVQEGGAKIRYPVGLDAEALVQARDRMIAAEWVELLSEPDEERFVARAAEAFGADLYNRPSLYKRSASAEHKTS